jgi:hypothetical protein
MSEEYSFPAGLEKAKHTKNQKDVTDWSMPYHGPNRTRREPAQETLVASYYHQQYRFGDLEIKQTDEPDPNTNINGFIITAWNPFSQNLPAKENQARQDELKANLKKRGLICIDGIGKHPSNNWPGEVSVLALGLDLEAAKSLARHYEQHAFVWAAGDGVPDLVQP